MKFSVVVVINNNLLLDQFNYKIQNIFLTHKQTKSDSYNLICERVQILVFVYYSVIYNPKVDKKLEHKINGNLRFENYPYLYHSFPNTLRSFGHSHWPCYIFLLARMYIRTSSSVRSLGHREWFAIRPPFCLPAASSRSFFGSIMFF